jgi:hypothetical protein
MSLGVGSGDSNAQVKTAQCLSLFLLSTDPDVELSAPSSVPHLSVLVSLHSHRDHD